MNRRGFFGRLFGLAAAPVVADAAKEEPKKEKKPLVIGGAFTTSGTWKPMQTKWEVVCYGAGGGGKPADGPTTGH